MSTPDPSLHDRRGLARLRWGAGFGVAGAFAGLVLPVLFAEIPSDPFPDWFARAVPSIGLLELLALAASALFLVSIMLYRWSFGSLRRLERQFLVPYLLASIGSVGLLLVVVAASLALGEQGALESCVRGAPTRALGCLDSLTPLGAYTATLGFWLGWIGAVGVVLGLLMAGARYASGSLVLGAILYVAVLGVLLLPIAYPGAVAPEIRYLAAAAPVLGLLAPAAVYAGARAASAPVGTGRPAPP